MRSPEPAYPDVPTRADFPALERRVLEYWRRERIFEASVANRPGGANEYVFYDGPPFANGLPHYGHLLTGYVKDVVPRYQTLRGRRVERRFGWDCHGLPAEMEAEKELGISGREAIEEFGIARFNEHCMRSVLQYTEAWMEYVTRQARWVDFRNDYKTMDLSYMESLLWAQKQLWEKDLLYEGFRVMPYSWAAQTVLSNFETRQDDCYRDRQDPAITVRFEVEPGPGDDGPLELWVWTTTPWTLPSNLAIAVGPEIEYAIFRLGDRRIVLGAACAEKYANELEGAARLRTLPGSALRDRRYRPLFPFFAERAEAGAFRVLAADFVDTEEGTGIVHIAPGFGEDDMDVCSEAGIELVCPVDDAGRFTAEVPPWQGQRVFDANAPIVRDLRERGALVRHETLVHSYPHCWRTDEPLIYRAVSSWFVRVSAIRERMVELNREIDWIPEHVRDGQFGKWIAGARDWSISRNRFWGTPIAVWKSDDPRIPRVDVYGSLAELERDFGRAPQSLHRPDIDALTRPNPDDPTGRSVMRRVPEVLDCWFESGSMPFAQLHYPFENREHFEAHFPADFITEYVGQTRGWFYTMMVLATALFDRPPFEHCICHGIVLDERGKKLSKRLRNYPSPEEVFETHGADALRWFLIASPILRGLNLQIDREGQGIREIVRRVLNPIWNAYSFFCLYANSEGVRARECTDAEHVLDRYALAKTRELCERVCERMDAYDLSGACGAVSGFVDALNNWYIRRSRDRFWRHGATTERAAYDTLYTALRHLCIVASPLLPLLSEEIYRGLTGAKSVHLQDWPDATALPEERALVAQMDRAREVCSTALALRRSAGVRVRQPLRKLTLAGRGVDSLAPYLELIQEEVNVKEVALSEDIERFAHFRLQLDARALGPRLGAAMQPVVRAARSGEWRALEDGRVELAGVRLEAGEFSLGLEADPGVQCQALPSNDAIVVLDTELDPQLEREGLARDVVRLVQQARRDAGLHVSDRITLQLELPPAAREATLEFRDYVSEQTLALELELDGPPGADASVHRAKLGRDPVRIALTRVAG
ncbi:MAG: isoleucine--tRNA ligase [Myxococcota bacterium]